MKQNVLRIELTENDLGQLLDGLEARADAWERTAEFLRTGDTGEDFFLIEECEDAEEADQIAAHYRRIVAEIYRQIESQRPPIPDSDGGS